MVKKIPDIASFINPISSQDVQFTLPTTFTFPFYYEPSYLAKIAAEDLQEKLKKMSDLEHNFGLNPSKLGLVIGKMFGVLIVETTEKQIGYLAAFSGKLANENHHPGFVPPVFDLLDKKGFYLAEEKTIVSLTTEIEEIINNTDYITCKENLSLAIKRGEEEIKNLKYTIKENKSIRDKKRKAARETIHLEELSLLENALSEESRQEQLFLKHLIRNNKKKCESLENELSTFERRIEELKEQRQQASNMLQKRIFDSYTFLNANGVKKSLLEIFENNTPPAGAGECCAPKLLQYAFSNGLKPLAMAEFWWGASPASEIRVHKNFYPACKGKCGPILQHMLEGLPVDPNPMLVNPPKNTVLPILFEDDAMLVIDKPEEFLSVPGINIKDSVYERIKNMYPNASGPLIVHRLDMSTSGILLIAKTKKAHHNLQRQFLKKTIKKEYTAVVAGELKSRNGTIQLPLRLDIDDRPRQMVCYEHGKEAFTEWELISQQNGHARVKLFPKTGRTHQLRVHAAHPLGLNAPILGDDLYGKKSNRLHLHASAIEFHHPVTHQIIRIESKPKF